MRTLSLFVFSMTVIACSAYNPNLAKAPFLCGDTDPKCPEGYDCVDDGTGRQVCVTSGGMVPDAGSGGGFQCADDSNLEGSTKNDTIQTAYQSPVAAQRKDITFAQLSICPEGDRDTYAIQIITDQSNLEAITSWDSGQPVSVSILNNAGMSINNGTQVSGMNALRAYVANLPTGTFYVQTYAASGVKNNYTISMTVTP